VGSSGCIRIPQLALVGSCWDMQEYVYNEVTGQGVPVESEFSSWLWQGFCCDMQGCGWQQCGWWEEVQDLGVLV